MSIYPEILAGYETARAILDEHGLLVEGGNLTVDYPGRRPMPDFTDPLALVAASPAAYSVKVMCLDDAATVNWFGRFGLGGETTKVAYPVHPEHEEFKQQLAAVLMPAVAHALAAADEERAQKTAADPDGPHEARDAVRWLT